MNKDRESLMTQLAFQVDDFQREVLPKIEALLKEEQKANDGMSKMPVNILTGSSAVANQIEVSDINIQGLKEAATILDKGLTSVYHILMQTYV